MKKVKWIALALVLCLGLIGGAYAWWTDTLEIDGSVETGSMEVYFSSASAANGYGGYDKAELVDFNEGDSELKFTVTDLYPREDPDGNGNEGDYVKIEYKVKNNGTIPVMLKSMTVEPFHDDDGLFEHIRAQAIGSHLDGTVAHGTGDQTTLQAALNAVVGHYTNHGAMLEPGGERSYGAYIWLCKNVEDHQNASASFKITTEFRQFNAPHSD